MFVTEKESLSCFWHRKPKTHNLKLVYTLPSMKLHSLAAAYTGKSSNVSILTYYKIINH
jgi:hypothetical protein